MSPPRPTLLLSAWEPELAPLRRLLARAAARPGDRAIECRAVGVGAVDAGINAARAIAALRPPRVIFVGTAGVYAAEGPALDGAVVVERLRLISTAVLRKDGYAPAPMIFTAQPSAPLSAELRRAGDDDRPVAAAVAACPLAITRTAALGRAIARAAEATVENLEAFSVARAAALAGVPFAAVLGISNRVGPRAHAEWLRHHQAASKAACAVVWSWARARAPRSRISGRVPPS